MTLNPKTMRSRMTAPTLQTYGRVNGLPSSPGYVLTGMNELVTMAPLVADAAKGDFSSLTPSSLGSLTASPWLAVDHNGKVAAYGEGTPPEGFCGWEQRSVSGGLILPGLVDSHTHPLWAGNRADEFVMKAQGKTYQEIATAGGGIAATVRASRLASDEELLFSLKKRLEEMLRFGVTSIEVKSGYGLSVDEELRHLRLLAAAQRELPWLTLHITCLALHALPPDGEERDIYIKRCSEELLPEAQRQGLIQSVDAFVEQGYFSTVDILPYLQKAKDLGLGIRLHADEFSDSRAALLGLDWQVQSLDHLQAMDPDIIPQWLQKSPHTVATLLPGTSLYSRIPFARGQTLRQAGIPVALASDYNPGSCLIRNLPLVASLAAVHCGLSVPEVVAGITLIPAFSLGLLPLDWGSKSWQKPERLAADSTAPATQPGPKGALAPGFDADMVHFPHQSLSQWIADFGQTMPHHVWLRGGDRAERE